MEKEDQTHVKVDYKAEHANSPAGATEVNLHSVTEIHFSVGHLKLQIVASEGKNGSDPCH